VGIDISSEKDNREVEGSAKQPMRAMLTNVGSGENSGIVTRDDFHESARLLKNTKGTSMVDDVAERERTFSYQCLTRGWRL
jgi:hypothetical protein